jgi:hypothetical protein
MKCKNCKIPINPNAIYYLQKIGKLCLECGEEKKRMSIFIVNEFQTKSIDFEKVQIIYDLLKK